MAGFDNETASKQALDASDAALDLAMSRWKFTAAKESSDVSLSFGSLPNKDLLSFCWTQEFDFSPKLLTVLAELFDGSGEQSTKSLCLYNIYIIYIYM